MVARQYDVGVNCSFILRSICGGDHNCGWRGLTSTYTLLCGGIVHLKALRGAEIWCVSRLSFFPSKAHATLAFIGQILCSCGVCLCVILLSLVPCFVFVSSAFLDFFARNWGKSW